MTYFLALAMVQAAATLECMSLPQARAFDFWLGSWDVISEAGEVTGQSTISLSAGGCAIQETFRGIDGEGSSISTFNAGAGRWERFFVNSSGLVFYSQGTSESAHKMQFVGEGFGKDGTRMRMRGTFWPEGDRVMQTLELGGGSNGDWRVVGRATYVRNALKEP